MSILPTGIIHVIGSDSQSSLPCETWHVAGNPSFHADSTQEKLRIKIEENLPRTDFKFAIGWTGYIDWKEPSPFGRYGWSQDEAGRMVFALGDYWGFQRYVHGDIFNVYHRSEPSHIIFGMRELLPKLNDILDEYIEKHPKAELKLEVVSSDDPASGTILRRIQN